MVGFLQFANSLFFTTMETVIAFSDEFEIVEDPSNFVHIMDGEQTVRISMPRDILNDLVRQIYSRVDFHM
ncbi:MAG: hypothetical protein EBU18_09155 [Rhodobacteraceae bacterium]|nr:hypothetical protein [Paracoccaceae bacterium]